jgi:hypothetical protein
MDLRAEFVNFGQVLGNPHHLAAKPRIRCIVSPYQSHQTHKIVHASFVALDKEANKCSYYG